MDQKFVSFLPVRQRKEVNNITYKCNLDKVNLFIRRSSGSRERPGNVLPWVSLDEMIKCTHFARNTKYVSAKNSLSSQDSMGLVPSSLMIMLDGKEFTVCDKWQNCVSFGLSSINVISCY